MKNPSVTETDFAGHTVLAVVQRLGRIQRFDKLAFFRAGELVELTAPVHS